MSKKIILFGVAFGSLAAAAFFVYYSKQLYLSEQIVGKLFKELALLVTTIVGVILCVININRSSENKATLSQLILSGLMTGTVICFVVTIMHSYLLKAEPQMINGYLDFMSELKKEQGIKLGIEMEEIKSQLQGMRDQFTSVFRYFFLQYSFVASISLLCAALVGYINVKRRA